MPCHRASGNGASMNGALVNGALVNEALVNGASMNRASVNGALVNGALVNEALVNGASMNRASVNGALVNGASVNGASGNGAWESVGAEVSQLDWSWGVPCRYCQYELLPSCVPPNKEWCMYNMYSLKPESDERDKRIKQWDTLDLSKQQTRVITTS
jgi:hypothetical protein